MRTGGLVSSPRLSTGWTESVVWTQLGAATAAVHVRALPPGKDLLDVFAGVRLAVLAQEREVFAGPQSQRNEVSPCMEQAASVSIS